MVAVHQLFKKIKQTGNVEKKTARGKSRTATNHENKEYIDKMIASQEECPKTHKFPQKILAQLHMSQWSVKPKFTNVVLKALKESEFQEDVKM